MECVVKLFFSVSQHDILQEVPSNLYLLGQSGVLKTEKVMVHGQ